MGQCRGYGRVGNGIDPSVPDAERRAALRRSLARRRGQAASRAFTRLRDAKRFRLEQERARQLGQLYDAPPERFGDFLAGWLARHERRVRPSTFEREAQSLRRFHGLSRYYVEEITAARVEEIVMAGGSRQGQIALRLIKMALSDARVRGQQVHEPILRSGRRDTRRAIRGF